MNFQSSTLDGEDAGWLLLCLLSAIFVGSWVVFALWSSPAQIIARFPDDAYYYFNIADNFANFGALSFDRIHVTNGFHPLWQLLLVPVFDVIPGQVRPLRTVGLFQIGLSTIILIVGIRYWYENYTLPVALVAAHPLVYFLEVFMHLGMENILVGLLTVLALTYMYERGVFTISDSSARELFVLGTLLSLVQISRLDGVLFSFIITLAVLYNEGRIEQLLNTPKHVVALLLPPFITGSSYVLWNLVRFREVTPVSQQAKSLLESSVIYWELITFEGIFRIIYMAMLLASVAYVLAYVLRLSERNDDRFRVGYYAALFIVAHMIFYLLSSSSTMRIWYLYPALSVSIFTIAAITDALKTSVREWVDISLALRIASVLLILTLAFFVMPANPYTHTLSETDAKSDFNYQMYNLSRHTDEEFDRDAIVAMGDRAGAYGYFSQNRVIHLEGLVNNHEFLEYLKNDSLGLYMSQNDVDYLIHKPYTTHNGSTYTISPTNPGAITRTHVTVHEDCLVYSQEYPQYTIKIWSWNCIESKDSVESANQTQTAANNNAKIAREGT